MNRIFIVMLLVVSAFSGCRKAEKVEVKKSMVGEWRLATTSEYALWQELKINPNTTYSAIAVDGELTGGDYVLSKKNDRDYLSFTDNGGKKSFYISMSDADVLNLIIPATASSGEVSLRYNRN